MTQIFREVYDHSSIAINLWRDGRITLHDYRNDFDASFPFEKIPSVMKIFVEFKQLMEEQGRKDFHTGTNRDIGYHGNYVMGERIPYILKSLRAISKVTKSSKSQLKRLTTKTILRKYNLIKSLLG